MLLILASWLVPTAGELDRVSAGWERLTQPVTDRVDRFGQVFLGIDSKRGNLIHHFDSALPLQGRVKLEDDPMYVVSLPSNELLRDDEFLHLRATAFDEYTRAGWQLSETDREPLPGTTIEAASFGTPETRTQLRRPVVTRIEVIRPLSDRRLLSAGDPLATDIEAEAVTGPSAADLAALQPGERVKSGDSYVTVGTVSAANPEILVGAGRDYPAWVTERYLQLPDSLPDRVRELAFDIAGNTESPYVAAFQIENYLRTNYGFNLKVDDQPPRRDPVDYFLFESREGYFDHHASAMAVMMRALGYPARVAVGFFVGEHVYDDETETYVLTEEDSWTWPEVYFPGLGWVEFNPTPLRAKVLRPGPQAFGLDEEDPLTIAEGTDELLLLEADAFGDEEDLAAPERGGAGADAAGLDFATPMLWLLAIVAALLRAVLPREPRLGVPVPPARACDAALGKGAAPVHLGRRLARRGPHAPGVRSLRRSRHRGRRARRPARALVHARALRTSDRRQRRRRGRVGTSGPRVPRGAQSARSPCAAAAVPAAATRVGRVAGSFGTGRAAVLAAGLDHGMPVAIANAARMIPVKTTNMPPIRRCHLLRSSDRKHLGRHEGARGLTDDFHYRLRRLFVHAGASELPHRA